jgi:hypothetical protein
MGYANLTFFILVTSVSLIKNYKQLHSLASIDLATSTMTSLLKDASDHGELLGTVRLCKADEEPVGPIKEFNLEPRKLGGRRTLCDLEQRLQAGCQGT